MNLSNETKTALALAALGIEENKTAQTKSNNVGAGLIGRVCMFRTYSAGVHYGELVERDGKECLLRNSRRIYSWTEACSLSQLAMEGSKDFNGCKIAMEVSEIFLSEVIEIIPMPESVVQAFKTSPVWKK